MAAVPAALRHLPSVKLYLSCRLPGEARTASLACVHTVEHARQILALPPLGAETLPRRAGCFPDAVALHVARLKAGDDGREVERVPVAQVFNLIS